MGQIRHTSQLRLASVHLMKGFLRIMELAIIAAAGIFKEFFKPMNYLTLGSLWLAQIIARALRFVLLYAQYYVGTAFEYFIVGVQYVINEVIKGIDKAGSGVVSVLSFGTHKHAVNIQPIDLVDDLPFIKEMENIMGECNRLDTYGDEVFVFLKMAANSHICPVVRYTWPTRFIYDTLHFFLSPFTYDPRPMPGCTRPADAIQCELANIYRVFELAFYIFLAWLVIKHCIPLIKYIVFNCILYALEKVTEEIYNAVHERIQSIHVSLGLKPLSHTI